MFGKPLIKPKVYLVKGYGSYWLELDKNTPVARFNDLSDTAYGLYSLEIPSQYNYTNIGMAELYDVDYSKLSKADYIKLMKLRMVELL